MSTPCFQVTAVVFLACFHFDGGANAAVMTFSDEVTFLSAVTPTGFESFEGLAPRPPTPDPIVTPLLTLTPTEGAADIRSTPAGGHFPTDGLQYVSIGQTGGGFQATLLFADLLNAIGFSFTDYGDSGPGSLVLTTDTGEAAIGLTIASIPPALPNGSQNFFALAQDTPFQQVTLTSTTASDGMGIDGIHLRVVPEPDAIVLALLSLVAVRSCGRRQSRFRRFFVSVW